MINIDILFSFKQDMVVSGIPNRTPFHAHEIANMAIDLVAECRVFEIPHLTDQPLKIRVGLHSGLFLSELEWRSLIG